MDKAFIPSDQISSSRIKYTGTPGAATARQRSGESPGGRTSVFRREARIHIQGGTHPNGVRYPLPSSFFFFLVGRAWYVRGGRLDSSLLGNKSSGGVYVCSELEMWTSEFDKKAYRSRTCTPRSHRDTQPTTQAKARPCLPYDRISPSYFEPE